MPSYVTISRKWNNPEIKTVVENVLSGGITLSMSMGDFIVALKKEIGSVTWVLTETAFNMKIDKAVENILYGIKEESAKVVKV